MTERKQQMLDQYRVVAHLARQIATVHEQTAAAYASVDLRDAMIDMLGNSSAALMETLGDILNGMDAVDTEEDAWTDAIFEAAHKIWPQP